MIGVGVGHFIAICATCGAVITGLFALFLSFYRFFVNSMLQINPYSGNEIADFVAYVLNFSFIGGFCSLYYWIFVSITISFITISIAEFVAHIYPLVVQFLRSQLNFISGDS